MQSIKASFGLGKAAILVMVVLGVSAALAVIAGLPVNNVTPTTSSTTETTTTTQQNALPQGLGSFQNYSELQSFIAINAKSAQQYVRSGGFFGGVVEPGLKTVTMTAAETVDAVASATQSTPSYTETNIQVQGVDEPDIVKTDGTHLFVSTTSTVTIINAYPPNSASILSTIKYQNSNILGIEIAQNRLLVINQRNTNTTYIDLLLYNTTNFSAPKLMENESIAGNYVASRLVQGYFYAIIQEPSYTFNNNGNATGVMPLATVNGVTITLPPSSVFYTPTNVQISYYTMVVSISMFAGKESTISVLTGPSSTVYVSTSNIYVVYANYEQYYADNIPGDVFTGGIISSSVQQGGQNSTIFRASYSNGTVTVEAAGSVPGTVLNQFSLNEYGSYFMVATSRNAQIGGTNTISDDVYALNMNMKQVSAIRNIAPGENIYAVSFVGDMGYVVTFEQVDPLFAISFQNITHPVILSALKVNGYSDYLYPLANSNLIGVGKDTVPASTGNYAYYLGLKLSLFQVLPNGTSSDVSDYFIGDRGTDSPVLTNHLAFTFDSATNVMVIPVTLALVSGTQTTSPNSPPPYGNVVWQGVYVFNVTTSGFNLLGRVSQYPASQNYGDSPNNNLQIDRSVIIGNYLYTISQGEVLVSNLSTFSAVSTLTLAGS